MSWLMATDGADAVAMVLQPVSKDLGSFRVRRALPNVQRQMVGPFIFFDHMGPAHLSPGEGMDVRPHPHIGLATLSYLLEGGIRHRDNLGSDQDIVPGDVNWMTAGQGVAHSERSASDRSAPRTVSGLQSWVALPRAREEAAPGFFHHVGANLPVVRDRGVSVRLVAGSAYGAVSPVATLSPMVYADVAMDAGALLPLPDEHAERGVYVLEGEVSIAGERHGPHNLLVFRPGDAITLQAGATTRLMVLGGEPMDGPRHLWWNFVHSSLDRIAQAKADWRAGRFDAVPGESEFIPLPD